MTLGLVKLAHCWEQASDSMTSVWVSAHLGPGALKKELLEHLRRSRAMRWSRHHTMKTEDHGRIRDVVSISERPATADDRAVPGHWEGDLLFGSANSQIATLVERQTRYVILINIARKDTATVIDALKTAT